MDLGDVAGRLKAVKTAKDKEKLGQSNKPFDAAESFKLRGKMLGVLINDARLKAERTPADCARAAGVSEAEFTAWEFGDVVPSLPQIELLAVYLDVPVSHFWGSQTLEARHSTTSTQSAYVDLRQRMIGALLRQAREAQHLSLEDTAAASFITPAQLARYELGEAPIPMHELSVLASTVKQNMSYFLETSSKIGELLANIEAFKHFNDLPEDLRAFAANPLNIGFIEIALAFSQMESERLKRIAVSMLDITGY